MTETIKALIWDFGGVLLRTTDQGPRQRWERELSLQPGHLHDIVFNGKASRRATVGEASTQDIWQAVGERLSLEPARLTQLQSDFWAGDILDHDLIDATRALRKHIKTALLSNAWPDLRPYLVDDLQIDDAFDLLVISAEEGHAKPDPAIYNTLLQRLGLPAETCLFIDDRPENVHAAKSVGIQGIIFRDRTQTLAEMHRLLPAGLAAMLPD